MHVIMHMVQRTDLAFILRHGNENAALIALGPHEFCYMSNSTWRGKWGHHKVEHTYLKVL